MRDVFISPKIFVHALHRKDFLLPNGLRKGDQIANSKDGVFASSWRNNIGFTLDGLNLDQFVCGDPPSLDLGARVS